MRRAHMVPNLDRTLLAPQVAGGVRLDSWKEIALYLRRGLTTVQRWEREEGLPVHRHLHASGGSVFAYAGELDRWRNGREPLAAIDGTCSPPIERTAHVPGGAMPPGSPHYVSRRADDDCRDAIARNSAIVAIKGARYAGKSSLLARALADARQRHAAVAFTDMQALGVDDLSSLKSFYQALGRGLAAQVRPACSIQRSWNDTDGPNTNFSRFVQRLLTSVQSHVVWGIDDVDRLAGRAYAVDVFRLFASWHNLRALDPGAPWSRLTLVVAHATECHLMMDVADRSPFDVGVRATLDDFDRADVAKLNECHRTSLDAPADVTRLMRLVGGHPYLLQCAFEGLRRGASMQAIERDARGEVEPFGEHLRRLRVLLQRDPPLRVALDAVIRDGRCEDRDTFYRLRSAGLVRGASGADAQPRCGLYLQLESDSR